MSEPRGKSEFNSFADSVTLYNPFLPSKFLERKTMAIPRPRGGPPKNPKIRQQEEEVEETQNESNNGGTTSEYEQSREQRIKENLQRMEKMGILDLSRKLKSDFLPPPPKRRKPSQIKPPSTSPRRSSR